MAKFMVWTGCLIYSLSMWYAVFALIAWKWNETKEALARIVW